MPDEVTLTIDGQSVTVPKGTVVVEAARKIQNLIPVFCYHPKLAPVGMCRMCVVKIGTPKVDRATNQPELDASGQPVIQMLPRLQTACTTPVSPGMVVVTDDEEVSHAQKGVLEGLLSSHPLDCPVCDKGGECPLQNLTMGWGPGKTRFDYADKVHFQKPIPLGDLIYLDRERCILCARCVRFEDEIAGDPVLGFSNRGREWEIISKSEPVFDSKFSGNTTDICPVGALTSADFRFKARVWELQPVPTVCNHCPVGCNMTFDMRSNEIMRVMPRENDAVNEIWLCDRGRFAHHFVDAPQRLQTPLVRRNGELQPATWDEALQLVANQLDGIRESTGGKAIAGLAGPTLANEDLFAFQRFFRETLGSSNLDHRSGTALDLPLDDFGATYGVTSGTDLGTLGRGTVVLVFGADLEEEAPVHLLRVRGIVARGGTLITANARPTKLDQSATLALQFQAGNESALLAGLLKPLADAVPAEGRRAALRGFSDLRTTLKDVTPGTTSMHSGVAGSKFQDAAKALGAADNLVIFYGREALAAGPNVTGALASMLMLTRKAGQPNSGLIALVPGANARGALDMGVRPDRGPGYTTVEKGLSASEMFAAARQGRIKALYIAGVDPVGDDPTLAEPLKKIDLVVVQELFLTETAQLADVVLPVLSVAEREGTFTNAERRVQRFRQAMRPTTELRPDWQIVQALAQQLTAEAVLAVTATSNVKSRQQARRAEEQIRRRTDWLYGSPADVMQDIAAAVTAYRAVSYTALQGDQGGWGRQTNENYYYDGTSYTNTGGVGIQLASGAEAGAQPLVQPLKVTQPGGGLADATLLLAAVPYLYDDGTLMTGSDLLNQRRARAVARLHAATAEQLNLQDGELVTLTSTRGSLTLPVQCSRTAPAGMVLVPLGVRAAPLAGLVEGAVTAVAIRRAEG